MACGRECVLFKEMINYALFAFWYACCTAILWVHLWLIIGSQMAELDVIVSTFIVRQHLKLQFQSIVFVFFLKLKKPKLKFEEGAILEKFRKISICYVKE